MSRACAKSLSPYARSGIAASRCPRPGSGREVFAAAGYPAGPALSGARNTFLPTAAGSTRPTALLPGRCPPGALDPACRRPTLIARDSRTARLLPAAGRRHLRAAGFDARATCLELPPSPTARLHPNHLCRCSRGPPFRAGRRAQLRAARGDATRIGLPRWLALRRAIRGRWPTWPTAPGQPSFEIPTLRVRPRTALYEILSLASSGGGRIQIAPVFFLADGMASASPHLAARPRRARAKAKLHESDALPQLGSPARYRLRPFFAHYATTVDILLAGPSFSLQAPLPPPDRYLLLTGSAGRVVDHHPIHLRHRPPTLPRRPSTPPSHRSTRAVASRGAALASRDLIRDRLPTTASSLQRLARGRRNYETKASKQPSPQHCKSPLTTRTDNLQLPTANC